MAIGGLIVTVVIGMFWSNHPSASDVQAAEPRASSTNADLVSFRAELDVLKAKATDQSHVMADVGYHFGNLWFAGEKKNWPLAKFYFDETRAHINWAIRVIPVRKDSAGRNVDLKPMWEAIDSSLFSQIGAAIEQKDSGRFTSAYRGAMEGCYSCHKASSKPYLRPQIPTAPPQPIINFDPDAKWPE
jgi:hypothetical protein